MEEVNSSITSEEPLEHSDILRDRRPLMDLTSQNPLQDDGNRSLISVSSTAGRQVGGQRAVTEHCHQVKYSYCSVSEEQNNWIHFL